MVQEVCDTFTSHQPWLPSIRSVILPARSFFKPLTAASTSLVSGIFSTGTVSKGSVKRRFLGEGSCWPSPVALVWFAGLGSPNSSTISFSRFWNSMPWFGFVDHSAITFSGMAMVGPGRTVHRFSCGTGGADRSTSAGGSVLFGVNPGSLRSSDRSFSDNSSRQWCWNHSKVMGSDVAPRKNSGNLKALHLSSHAQNMSPTPKARSTNTTACVPLGRSLSTKDSNSFKAAETPICSKRFPPRTLA